MGEPINDMLLLFPSINLPSINLPQLIFPTTFTVRFVEVTIRDLPQGLENILLLILVLHMHCF